MSLYFNYGRIPPLHFGTGKLALLPKIASQFGGKGVLLVKGRSSLHSSGWLDAIFLSLEEAGFHVHSVKCPGEPTTSFVDEIAARFRRQSIDVVIGIGGGSVIDAGKAISAMLPHDNSIFDHLEGVGRGIPHSGIKKPYIAVPTTSGTGSEVTKNAVISEVGPSGYKKSLRHDNLIPDAVVVDGDLLVSCPRNVTFACGIDAFTQLLEPFLAPKVSRLTEALVQSALEELARSFPHVCKTGAQDRNAREAMAYAALLSGVALANDGVGIVHGLASPIGGFFSIPHGVVCANLVAPSVRANLSALRTRDPESPALKKMAWVGALFAYGKGKDPGIPGAWNGVGPLSSLARSTEMPSGTGKTNILEDPARETGGAPFQDWRETLTCSSRKDAGFSLNPDEAPDAYLARNGDDDCDALLGLLDKWTVDFQTPRLGEYGIDERDLEKILDEAQNRNNPIALTRDEIRAMLEERL